MVIYGLYMVIMDITGNSTGNIGNSQYPLQFHWRIHCYSFFCFHEMAMCYDVLSV